DLHRPQAGRLQDGDHRRRRARGGALPLRRRVARADAARDRPMEQAGRMSTFVDAFRFMANHDGLLLSKTGQHLELSAPPLGIALVLAVPLGLGLGHLHRGLFLAASFSSIGRALPSLALIALGLTVFGFGFWNNTAALVVLAVPPILTNAYLAISGADRDV